MDKLGMLHLLRLAVRTVPDVLPHLSPATRYQLSVPTPYKTFDFFRSAIIGLVEGVYQGFIAGAFIQVMDNLLSGQIYDAYMRAWADEGFFREIPDYLMRSYESFVIQQQSFVTQFYREIRRPD